MSAGLHPALLDPALRPTAGGGAATPRAPARSSRDAAPGPSFASALEDATAAVAETPAGAGTAAAAEPVRFSKHALERVQRRGIELDRSTLARLHDGVGRAAGKGSRNSIVLVNGTAFVVSVNNRTVITAVGSEHMREHVFTNIDSAVIA